MCIYIHIYIYMCVCDVCIYACMSIISEQKEIQKLTHTNGSDRTTALLLGNT